jgi:hypothetical protein
LTPFQSSSKIKIGLINERETLTFFSGIVQVKFKRLHIITSAFSYQTADGSGKPKAVWVFKAKVGAQRNGLQVMTTERPAVPLRFNYESGHVGWTSISIPET